MNKFLVLIIATLMVSGLNAQEAYPWDGARVTWTAPIEREDITPLSPDEIAGYQVFWGPSPELALEGLNQVDIGNITSYQVTNLTLGRWYFGVKAVDTGGLVSVMSSIGTKLIEAPILPPKPPTDIEIR